MSESPQERAPMGGPAESEVPLHTADVDRGDVGGGEASQDRPLEDSLAYELAVEDGAPLSGSEADDPGAGEAAPRFREPGEA